MRSEVLRSDSRKRRAFKHVASDIPNSHPPLPRTQRVSQTQRARTDRSLMSAPASFSSTSSSCLDPSIGNVMDNRTQQQQGNHPTAYQRRNELLG